MTDLTIECKRCERKDEFSSESSAHSNGWRKTELAGNSGPWLDYAFGLCPKCAESDEALKRRADELARGQTESENLS